ncbi:MAG: inorganic diphosphatase [Candidatus Doudnabacteria bacterium]|nr:inorganic diphosphatase [Candidatus Doudnabacteria bacterium]
MGTIKIIPFGEVEAFNAVIEVPQGEMKKYAYDPELGSIKLTRVLYDGIKFPFNYGFVAGTENHDGGHLDVFVISTHAITRGTVVVCRAIGVMEMEDQGKPDHKIIAVPNTETRLANLKDIKDFEESEREKISLFYRSAAEQWGLAIKLLGFADKAKAKKELLRTLQFE